MNMNELPLTTTWLKKSEVDAILRDGKVIDPGLLTRAYRALRGTPITNASLTNEVIASKNTNPLLEHMGMLYGASDGKAKGKIWLAHLRPTDPELSVLPEHTRGSSMARHILDSPYLRAVSLVEGQIHKPGKVIIPIVAEVCIAFTADSPEGADVYDTLQAMALLSFKTAVAGLVLPNDTSNRTLLGNAGLDFTERRGGLFIPHSSLLPKRDNER